MSVQNIVVLIILFQVKHFIVDFLLQTRLMVQQKDNLRMPGGYIHAAQHAVGTVLIGSVALQMLPVSLALSTTAVALIYLTALYDGVSHYLIDYCKMRHGRRLRLGPEDRRYWAYIGLDQLAHNLVYAHIIYLWSK